MYRLRLDPQQERIGYLAEDEYIKDVDAFFDVLRESVLIEPFTTDTDVTLLTMCGTNILIGLRD